MDTSFPDRRRTDAQSGDARPPSAAALRGPDAREGTGGRTPPRTMREPRAFMDETPTWHLWGMMVGFMAAGAAILIILSLKGA